MVYGKKWEEKTNWIDFQWFRYNKFNWKFKDNMNDNEIRIFYEALDVLNQKN